MTPESLQAAEPEPKGMGEASRLMGVFFEPAKTFEDVARRPRWIVPMLLLVLAGLAFAFCLQTRVGWDRVVDQQMEPALAKATPEQRAAMEQRMPMQRKFAPVAGFCFAIIGPILMGLIVAGVLTGIAGGMMGGGIKFKQMFAIYFYSGMVSVVFSALCILMMFLKAPEDFNLRNPLAFNVGAFLDPNSGSRFVYALATAFDAFTFWRIALFAIGIKAAAGRNLSMGGAFTAVFAPWLVITLISAGLAGIFS
jgi:hypothetical protein